MGILANSVSISQYLVDSSALQPGWREQVGERLAGRGFRSIDRGSDELSVGWVHLDDSQRSDFSSEGDYRRDHWFALTVRRDQRRIPAPLFKAHFALASRDYLTANPGLARIPKGKRDELKEAVHGSLLARTLPIPAVYDAVWEIDGGLLTIASLSPKITEIIEGLFKQTFEGCTLVPLHPYLRAERVVAPELLPALQEANQSQSDGVLELIRDNRWLGEDFLLWLLYRTMTAAGDYAVNQPGPAGQGELFTAFIDERLSLFGEGNNGAQKMTVSGPQDSFREVRAALQGGKRIREALICLEKQEHSWRLNLKGETFAFASYKTPAVKLEKDDLTDAVSEREAVFFEKMSVMEEGLQLFDSLYATFLGARLTPQWHKIETAMIDWLAEG